MLMFIKLVVRQSNIVCIVILSLLKVKTNSLAIFLWYPSDSYVIPCFFNMCGYENSRVLFMVARILILFI